MYQSLLQPILVDIPSEIEELIIIADGEMASIPWELLIQEKPGESDIDYGNLKYLLKDFTISYAYSATLLFNEHFETHTSPSNMVLAFAPSYPTIEDSTAYSSVGNLKSNFRNALVPLQWNTEEVESIRKNLKGNYFTSGLATESAFKKEAANHRILHLSMHALVDHEDPMLSKLVFTPDNDSIEDGMLHTYELFNMNLSAEMVVLSACETGIGEFRKGEGVMSLGRAFAYSGCPSVIMSHWSVDDESTAELMALFYQYINDGEDKASAMRRAKLDFLDQAIGPKKHPFYWGGFIILGNTDPLEAENYLAYWIWLFVLGAGVLAATIKKKGM